MGMIYWMGNPHRVPCCRLGNSTKIDAECPVSISNAENISVMRISFLYSFSFMDGTSIEK
jgi:hypothetical protein